MQNYIIKPNVTKSKINKEIYGNFSEHLGRCIYEGIFVGEDSPIPNVNGMRTDVVEAFRNIKLPVLRWPGGCFADEYHWKDGIGLKEGRKRMINTHWGGVVEDNSFGTHEFMELCRQVGCEPYINGNLGSGTVQEMQEWVEYLTFSGVSPMSDLRAKNGHEQPWKVRYFGVGNENWGCGGNMRPEYYADEYRRYQTYVRNYGDNKLYKIACGAGCSIENPGYDWTEVLMKNAGNMMNGLSLHYYTLPNDSWQHKGSATDFDDAAYYKTIKKASFMEELVTKHGEIMDKYDPEHKVGMIVDEWGTWYDVEPGTNPGFLYQQNTLRDAIIASMTLNVFNKHSDRVYMANIAQVVNVLQAIILTEGEKMVLTPTYHVFDLFKAHQDATLVESSIDSAYCGIKENTLPQLNESASIDADGNIHITLSNCSLTESANINAQVLGSILKLGEALILTGKMDEHNTFEETDRVAIVPLNDVVVTVEGDGTAFTCTLPPVSVVSITLKK